MSWPTEAVVTELRASTASNIDLDELADVIERHLGSKPSIPEYFVAMREAFGLKLTDLRESMEWIRISGVLGYDEVAPKVEALIAANRGEWFDGPE